MAAAMARGWAGAEHGPEAMAFADSGSGRAAKLAAEVGGTRAESLADLARLSDLVVLAVKPAALAAVAPELDGRVDGAISVLGVTTVADLRAAMPRTPVLRTMPNIFVGDRRGVIVHTPAGPEDRALHAGLELLGELGIVIKAEERDLDAVTAVAGCSGAYFARAAEALIDAGVEAGLDPALAARIVSETAAGAGESLRERDPASIQRAIASPGGSTEAGLEALEEAGGPAAFAAAVTASLERMAGTR